MKQLYLIGEVCYEYDRWSGRRERQQRGNTISFLSEKTSPTSLHGHLNGLEMKMERVNESATGSTQRRPSLFSIPAPLRDLFDLFPQTTYAPNDLPLRPYLALRADADKLFVWTTENGAKLNAASFNPACLKWQV